MPDTAHGITYPDSSAHTRIWEHFQTLAEDVDGIVPDTEANMTALKPNDMAVPVGVKIIAKGETAIPATDAGGIATIVFPSAFPNGVILVLVTVENANGAVSAQPVQALTTVAQCGVVIRNAAGAVIANTAIRLGYIAWGW